jgi:peptidoglycan/xylan/chitin deacetylase (PgdA/CDA1 family)
MEAIVCALGSDPRKAIPLESPYSMLRHSDIREMVDSGLIEIGAHTMSHAILSRLSEKERRAEISGSIAAVHELTGRSCRVFAYPNGTLQDFGSLDEVILQENRIVAAVSAVEGPNFHHTQPMRLRRYGLGAEDGLGLFQMTVHNLRWYLYRRTY